jgi:hypothetical protein
MECETSVGLEESFALVEDVFKTQGPFDGVFSFSQGAAFTALLASYARSNPGNKKVQFYESCVLLRLLCYLQIQQNRNM